MCMLGSPAHGKAVAAGSQAFIASWHLLVATNTPRGSHGMEQHATTTWKALRLSPTEFHKPFLFWLMRGVHAQ